MNLFLLQFDLHLPKTHEFYVGMLFWFNKPTSDPNITYEGLWKLAHDWIRRKNDTKNRREALKDHLPNLSAHGGKGTGKDKNGEPQVCFAWRNTGVCARKDAGTCIYAHPQSAKNTGKPAGDKGKGKSKDGKQKRSSSSSRTGAKGDARGRSPSTPRSGKAVTDTKLFCQNFLKGKCDKGKSCKYHHNGMCSFHKKGTCNRGDKCVFSHHDPPAGAMRAAPATTELTPKTKAAAAKAKAKGTEKT